MSIKLGTVDIAGTGGGVSLPSQAGNAGKYLSTNGTTASWEEVPAPSFRNIGEIVASTIPLTDAGLHLLDGSLISGSGSYSAFVDYIADLYEASPTANYFMQSGSLDFVQPILTANGTLGGNSFAVGSENDYSGRPQYYLFDGNSSSAFSMKDRHTDAEPVIIYNPKALNVTGIKITFYNSADYGSSIQVFGSNDNTTYTDLGTFSNSSQVMDIDLSSNTNYYNYYKILCLAGTSDADAISIKLTATYQVTPEELWQYSVATYGVCDKYVYDSINNTVRIPKRTTEHGALVKSYSSGTDWYRVYQDGWCEQGGNFANDTDITFLKEYEAIPSVFCSPATTDTTITNQGLCISKLSISGFHINTGSSWSGCWQSVGYIDISGYGYSPIYEYLIIATSTKTDIQVDIDEIATDLNGKADVDLTNISVTGKSTITTQGIPDWDNAYNSLRQILNNTNFTAPTDGVVIGRVVCSTSASSYVYVYNANGTLIYQYQYGNASNTNLQSEVYIPLLKSYSVKVVASGNEFYSCDASGTQRQYGLFVPLKGAN